MIAIAARRTDYIQRFLLLALMLCVSACGGGHDAAPTTTSSAASSATSDHAEAKARSENVLDRAIEAGSPGCSAAVGVKGNAVWTGVRGVADMSSGTAITTQAVFDIASVSKQFTARQPGAVAAYESEHKSERPKSARVQQAKQGKYHGGMRCYGYEKDGITIRANEAAEIASACTAIAGGASLRSIVRDMNARKVPTTRGKVGGWTSRQLRLMLMSPRIAGICICGESALRSSSNGGSRRHIYLCSNPDRSVQHVTRSTHVLDAYVGKLIVERLSRPGTVEKLLRRDDTADVATLRVEQVLLDERKDKAAAMFIDGAIDEVQLATITKRADERAKEIAEVRAKAGWRSPLEPLAGGNIEAVWEQLSLVAKRAILEAVADAHVLPTKRTTRGFDPDGVRIDWKVS